MDGRLSEQVKQKLLSAILSGQFGPNGPLPTIRELARSFKVSTNTVQKAIHELSRDGIVEARPGRGTVIKSAGPANGDSRLVGVPLPYADLEPLDPDGRWPHAVLISLRERLAEAGHSMVLCPLLDVDELAVVEHLSGLGLGGIALFEVYNDHLVTEIRELRLPMISMDYDTSHLGISSVVFDNAWGGYQATRHLIDRGHRHIVSLHPWHRRRVGRNPFLDAVDRERVEGYRLAMMAAGLSVRTEEYVVGDRALRDEVLDTAGTVLRAKLLELFGTRPIPTAIMCRNDSVAHAIVRELRALEIRVPEDVSVVGFGDERTEFAPGRRLTSVWVDRDGMGATAAQYVLREMKRLGGSPRCHRLPTRLAEHDSVADICRAAVGDAAQTGAD